MLNHTRKCAHAQHAPYMYTFALAPSPQAATRGTLTSGTHVVQSGPKWSGLPTLAPSVRQWSLILTSHQILELGLGFHKKGFWSMSINNHWSDGDSLPGGGFSKGKANQSLSQGNHTTLNCSLGKTRASYLTSEHQQLCISQRKWRQRHSIVNGLTHATERFMAKCKAKEVKDSERSFSMPRSSSTSKSFLKSFL